MGVAGCTHLRRIGIEDCLVVGLVVLVEDLVVLLVDLVAIGLGSLLGHLDAAVRHEGTLQGLVCLKADDLFELLVLRIDVSRAIGGKAGNDLGLAVEDAALGALLLLELLDIAPELVCRCGRTLEEGLVSLILGVVALDEVADVHVLCPVARDKSLPCFRCCHQEPPIFLLPLLVCEEYEARA